METEAIHSSVIKVRKLQQLQNHISNASQASLTYVFVMIYYSLR